ncbi:hypothetical protein [Taylorella asinigenitalis]|uniref:Putative phage protein n=1 Tax=Taylorella asinigenitalis (strain MCE3) TaxID=1008459 RepID=G4QCU1_TAYAM|nr:hypothetical protein [Taylorella asinigenitalis]AEP36221.1 putative phage protein [Taylorella asinigenitalis MCE3]
MAKKVITLDNLGDGFNIDTLGKKIHTSGGDICSAINQMSKNHEDTDHYVVCLDKDGNCFLKPESSKYSSYIEIESLTDTEHVKYGDTVTITLRIRNTGLSTVYGAMLTFDVEGLYILDVWSEYFEHTGNDVIMAEIEPDVPYEVEITVEVTSQNPVGKAIYTQAYGVQHTVVHEFLRGTYEEEPPKPMLLHFQNMDSPRSKDITYIAENHPDPGFMVFGESPLIKLSEPLIVEVQYKADVHISDPHYVLNVYCVTKAQNQVPSSMIYTLETSDPNIFTFKFNEINETGFRLTFYNEQVRNDIDSIRVYQVVDETAKSTHFEGVRIDRTSRGFLELLPDPSPEPEPDEHIEIWKPPV